jgi:hypothetical protein
MTDKNQDTDDQDLDKDDEDTGGDDDASESKGKLSKEHSELLEKLVAEKLKGMKSNVDKAYKQAETLAKENARLKAEQQENARKKLEDEGKHLEAEKLRRVELEETVKVLNERLVAFTRDKEVDREISSLPFKSEYAKEMAFKSIVEELVQDDDGAWVHKSGASLKDYVKTFAKDPIKEFLFKPKENQGAGQGGFKGTAQGGKPKDLSKMTSAELLEAAQKGLLGNPFSPL